MEWETYKKQASSEVAPPGIAYQYHLGSLRYNPGQHAWKDPMTGRRYQDWGRGVLTPEGQMHTWPSDLGTHNEKLMELGYPNQERGDNTPVQFKIDPEGQVRVTEPGYWYNKMHPWIEQQLTQYDPRLQAKPVDPDVYRHAWDPETGEWIGTSSWHFAGTDAKPYEAKMWHGKPNSKGILGPVRTPFWTTSHQPEAVGFSGGEDMRGSVHPVQVRFNRPVHYFAHSNWGPGSIEEARSQGADGIVVHWPEDYRDPSDPMPARKWAIALDPGTVVPGHLEDPRLGMVSVPKNFAPNIGDYVNPYDITNREREVWSQMVKQTFPYNASFINALTPSWEGGHDDSHEGVIEAQHPEHGGVGFLDYALKDSEDRRYPQLLTIGELYTHPSFRNQGVASWLMHNLEQRYPGVPIYHGVRTDAGEGWAHNQYGPTGSTWTLDGQPLFDAPTYQWDAVNAPWNRFGIWSFPLEEQDGSTEPTEVMNPEDIWPEFGDRPPDRPKNTETDYGWGYTRV